MTAYAFAAAAMGAEFADRPGGPALAARGVQGAVEARDWWGFVHASLWEANTSASNAHDAWARVIARAAGAAGRAGRAAPVPRVAVDRRGRRALPRRRLEGGDANCSGSLSVPTPVLRPTSRPGSWPRELAAAQGRQHEAEDHLCPGRRAVRRHDRLPGLAVRRDESLVRTGAGDARGAYAAALTGLLSAGVPPTMCEWLCPLAARALADLVGDAKEQGADPGEHLVRVDDLVDRFPHVVPDGSMTNPGYRRQVDALDALYAAEVARARGDPEEVSLWRRAAEELDGPLPWDAAYAAFRAGESLLLQPAGSREDAAALLRRAATLAADLEAEPVLREVTALAAAARISLDPVEAAPADAAGALPGLTKREREILGHIVAGRTYGEIARALFLSEKTISSHVSNILRKTGCANRVELARRAQHAANRGTQQ